MQSICSSMCAPLKPRDDLVGVLYVDNLSSDSIFSEDDLEFLLAFASQAAVAIENAALYRRLEAESALAGYLDAARHIVLAFLNSIAQWLGHGFQELGRRLIVWVSDRGCP